MVTTTILGFDVGNNALGRQPYNWSAVRTTGA